VTAFDWQDGHFEEAQLLRSWEVELKQKLAGPAEVASTKVPLVSTADVEAVVSAWSGVPVHQMSSDEMKRLRQLQDSLQVCKPLISCHLLPATAVLATTLYCLCQHVYWLCSA